MKTILVVAYHFFPEEGSCSEKNGRIVKILLDYGYKVVVLTKPGESRNNEFSHPNLKIIRTLRVGFLHKGSGRSNCNVKPSNGNSKLGNLKKWLSKQIIPDSIIDWAPEVRKVFYSCPESFKGIDLILSISSPYSAHIASYFLSKKLRVPYVMSYGDPWIYEPKRKRGWFRYKTEYQLENFLIKKSSGILLITGWNKNRYQDLYGIDPKKVSTFHIGFDKKDVMSNPSPSNDKFEIIYGGSLDPVHRDPEPLIEAVKMIEGIHVTIYNSDNKNVADMIEKYGVSDKVCVHPIISASSFLNEMYKSDALLLFGNKTPYQVPGKVFTYIATGKTIIYLKNNDYVDDGTEMILKQYGNTVVMKNDTKEIEKQLMNFMISHKADEGIDTVNRDKFEFHITMLPIVEMIDSVIGNN